MVRFINTHKYLVGAILIAGALGVYGIYSYVTVDPLAGLITTKVERGDVESLVSVSGITRARNTAELGFKTPGTVSTVFVREGDQVETGDILATLGAEELVASRASAVADLRVAEADLAELLSGNTVNDRAVTETKTDIAKAELERVTATQSTLVENATRALRSSSLTAQTTDTDETATAPIITGTYTCNRDGIYTLRIYSSNAQSGYSMQVTGLESGTYPVSTDQPVAFGSCGLFAQFSENDRYTDSIWTITIPNTAAATYVTNRNALDAAKTTAETSIAAAREALILAERQQTATNAAPRNESVSRARARIDKAQAQIAQIDAQLGDRAIQAPFAGMITTVDIVAGESAGTAPLFTLLATDNIELKARIPEIDITTITLGQSARVIFDAQSDTTLRGTVVFISPLPIQIDGVGYFEITIALDSTPSWLRGGLNADIDIITSFTPDVLRIPKRYLIETDAGAFIRVLNGTDIATTTVTKDYEGNDGWVSITGATITEGAIIVTP